MARSLNVPKGWPPRRLAMVEAGNLASLRLGILRFAPYRSWSVSNPDLLGWVAIEPDHAKHAAVQ